MNSSSAAPAANTALSAASAAVSARMAGIANKGAVAVAVVLTLLLIVVIIAYIVWRLNRSNLQAIDIVKDPVQLNGKGALGSVSDGSSSSSPKMPIRIPASKLPAMYVGQEFSMSFWLYLNDFQATSMMKLLINRMPGNNGVNGANPVVFLDQTTNKLYVAIGTNRKAATPKATLDSLLVKSGKGPSNNWTYLVATIDYVPLQRWVHVAFTVQDNTLTMYQDGGMYTVASLYDMVDPTNAISRPAFGACVGEMTIGNSSPTLSSDTTGFISRTQFFNYSLAASQVSQIYFAGPTSSNLLRSLGVPEYGVRSPVYRLDG
jgi:hypothetical protein